MNSSWFKSKDMQLRISDNYIPEPNSGCWLWTGFTNEHGYGLLSVRENGKKKLRRAHRISYELKNGPIPKGLQIDHLCRVRCCVNPDHMEPVTLVENVMRGESFYAQQARRTHCPRGHEYSGRNLHVGSKGERKCRACDLERYYERKYKVKRWILRYVAHENVFDYMKCGWHLAIPDLGHPHNQYSVAMSWLCNCKMVEPLK